MKQRKYAYLRVLQQNGGYGWDDVEHFDTHDSTVQQRKQAMKEYKDNMSNYSYRWIDRREIKQ